MKIYEKFLCTIFRDYLNLSIEYSDRLVFNANLNTIQSIYFIFLFNKTRINTELNMKSMLTW